MQPAQEDGISTQLISNLSRAVKVAFIAEDENKTLPVEHPVGARLKD